MTVSGLLSGQQGPGRDADGALALDLLVVLDAPQLDLETAALLVESLTDGTRLVLSGDPGVLWSAGPGPPLRRSARGPLLPSGRLPYPGLRPDRRAGLGHRHRRAEPGRGARQGSGDRPGAGRRRGGAPHRPAGRRLRAPGARCPRGPHAGHHGRPRRRGRHPRAQRRPQGTAQPRPRPVRRLRPRRPRGLRPGARPHGARHGHRRGRGRTCISTATAPRPWCRASRSPREPYATAGRSPRIRRPGRAGPPRWSYFPGTPPPV